MKLAERLGLALERASACRGAAAVDDPPSARVLLDSAKGMAHDNVLGLDGAMAILPYIFLEPSCLSAFTDDYLTLVDPAFRSGAVAG